MSHKLVTSVFFGIVLLLSRSLQETRKKCKVNLIEKCSQQLKWEPLLIASLESLMSLISFDSPRAGILRQTTPKVQSIDHCHSF